MNENERQARRIAVAAIAKLPIAYGKEMPDEQIDIYIDALCDLEADALARAVDVLISTEKFFPSIAGIREAALVDTNRLSAEEAWAFITRRIQSGGRAAGTRGLTEETKNAVDACGGWVALCESQNPTSERFTFVRSYNAALDRHNKQQALKWKVPKALKAAIASIGKDQA